MLEWLAVITTLWCVYLTSKSNILCWPVGIIASTSYMIIFESSHLFGLMVLQVVFIAQGVYGWITWKYNIEENGGRLKIKTYGLPRTFLVLLILLIYSFVFKCFFIEILFLDILVTILSLIATYFLIKRYFESWILWIITDILSVFLFYSKELYVSSFLYLVLLVIAVYGLIQWRKEYYERV